MNGWKAKQKKLLRCVLSDGGGEGEEIGFVLRVYVIIVF